MWVHYVLTLYILTLGILLGTGKKLKIKKILYIVLTFGLFVIISALRGGNVGNDTHVYLNLFTNISLADNMSDYTWRYEIGYVYLNKILSMMVSDPQIIIIVTSIIILLGFARFIYKYSEIPWLSTFLFFTLGYYGMTMNTIRLNLAIIIILFAYDFIKERKLIKFILMVTFASLFHRTAIVFLFAWPITKLKINFRSVISFMGVSVFIYIMFPIFLEVLLNIFPLYQYYLGTQYIDGEIRLASIMNMLVGLSIVIFGILTRYYKGNNIPTNLKENNLEKKNNDGQHMLLLLMAGVSITFISFNFNLLERVGDYFLVFSCIYLPNAINQIKDKKLSLIIIYIVVILFFLYATIIQIMRPDWNIIYPYNFFWRE